MRHMVRADPSRPTRRRPSPVEYALLLAAILLVLFLVVFEFDRYVQAADGSPCARSTLSAVTCADPSVR